MIGRIGQWRLISGAEHVTVEVTRRGTQVVRERSAKPLCVGSIPTRASRNSRVTLRGPTCLLVSPGDKAASNPHRIARFSTTLPDKTFRDENENAARSEEHTS